MMRTDYVVVSLSDGSIRSMGETRLDRVPLHTGDDPTLRALAVDAVRSGDWRVDLRRLCKDPLHRYAFDDLMVERRLGKTEQTAAVDRAKVEALAAIDATFAVRIAAIVGPLAALHAEKRRQAEAGGGPLIDGETDRAAILAKAAEQDARVAELDRERRAMKARVRAGATAAEINAILATIHS